MLTPGAIIGTVVAIQYAWFALSLLHMTIDELSRERRDA